MNSTIELYTDGSCLRNPGIGGLSYIIRYWDTPPGSIEPGQQTIEYNQGFRLTTNNRMEIMAGIYGIKRIIDLINTNTFNGINQINLFSDSEYFCNAINQKWIQKWSENNWMTSSFKGSQPKPVKNKDLWESIIEIQNSLRSIGVSLIISHVKGHNGNEFNEKCDKLAVAASNGVTFSIDEMYEKSGLVPPNKR